MEFRDLQPFGLSDKEARVYLALLELGESVVSKKVKKRCILPKIHGSSRESWKTRRRS